jgi:hypothetical protein
MSQHNFILENKQFKDWIMDVNHQCNGIDLNFLGVKTNWVCVIMQCQRGFIEDTNINAHECSKKMVKTTTVKLISMPRELIGYLIRGGGTNKHED